MQINNIRLFFNDPEADERFLEMLKDSTKRQEHLKVLERRRMMSTWSLFVFAGLLLLMAVAALTSSNPGFFFFPIAMTTAMGAGAAARQSDADAQIKMIKLYVMLAQKPG